MSNKLFVGGLSWGTDVHGLRAAFSAFGEVTEAKVIMERDTGRSRGFGFVTFQDSQEASAAIAGLDGAELDGRNIRVNVAEDKARGGSPRGGHRGDDRRSYGGDFGDRGGRGW